MKHLRLLLILSLFMLAACKKENDTNIIKVGTISGPETALMEVAKEVAKKDYNITVKIVPFTDYVLPNQALAEGSIDANMFQHKPYLDKTIDAKKYELTVIGKTFIYPMGIYTIKHKRLHDIPEKSVVAIPNDPSNEARALLLLQKAGLIELKNSGNTDSTLSSITSNPKNLVFKEIDAAQLPRVLPDVDLAVINTNYAILANLVLSRDSIYDEDITSLYANVVVVNTKDKDREEFKKLMLSLHSPEVVEKAKELFKGQAIKAW